MIKAVSQLRLWLHMSLVYPSWWLMLTRTKVCVGVIGKDAVTLEQDDPNRPHVFKEKRHRNTEEPKITRNHQRP